jgi:FHA domain-containing protein
MTGERPPAPALVALDGPVAGAQISIPNEGLRVGRNAIPALQADPAVSGRHALVRWTGDGRLMIEDEGSRNGTWVNGAAVTQPTIIGTGDRIQIGQGTYELRIARPAAPPPPSYTQHGNRDTVEIEGGIHATSGGVAAGRDIHGNIHTGDYYDVDYDPTGLSQVSGFPKFLMVLGIFVALAGFALFAYPIVMAIASVGTTDPFSACSDLETGSQAWIDCNNANFGDFGIEVTPWLPIGAALFFGGMVLTIVARVMQRDDRSRPRRRAP